MIQYSVSELQPITFQMISEKLRSLAHRPSKDSTPILESYAKYLGQFCQEFEHQKSFAITKPI